MVCVAPPSGASVCAHCSLAPTRTPPAHPHSPLPQELHRDLTSCPKPAPHSWGAMGAQGRPHLAFFFFFLISFLTHPTPWCCVRPWLWCCRIFPLRTPSTALCVGSPCSCLVCLGIPPGFGEPGLSHPPTLEFFCVLFVGNRGQRELQDEKHPPPPHSRCCSSSRREVTPCPPLS